MPFIKKPLKAAIQLVSTTDFREDDLKIAQDRFKRISKAFVEYRLSIPHHHGFDGNQTHCVLLGTMPDIIKMTLKVKPAYYYFALVENNREHRFMTEYGWDWLPGLATPLIPRDQLYEEVMEFVNDYSDLD